MKIVSMIRLAAEDLVHRLQEFTSKKGENIFKLIAHLILSKFNFCGKFTPLEESKPSCIVFDLFQHYVN